MKYAKIKQGTEAWELINKIFTFHEQWAEHQGVIEEFLGFPMDGNIAFEINNLWVESKVLKANRPDWVKDFKKVDVGITSAKANSKIGKAWKELCKSLGLETHRTRDFTWEYNLIFMGSMEWHKQDSEYLMTVGNDKFDCSNHDWADEITEAKFLRIRADYLEKKEQSA